jgi:hypothetical protein
MNQTLALDTLATISTAGWMSYEEFAEEYWEKPIRHSRPARSEIIPESELPF